MLITEIVGNTATVDLPASDWKIETITFDDESRLKRIQRAVTSTGEEVGLRLSNEYKEIKPGDILYQQDGRAIVADVKPTDVLIISPRSIHEALSVAHALGNRHLQAQFFTAEDGWDGEVMVVRYDHTVQSHLEHVQVPFTRDSKVMPEAFRHAEHTH